jgi:hypothetical protein
MEELLVGVDWSQSHYDLAVVAPNGALLSQFRIAKTAPEFSLLAGKIDSLAYLLATALLVWKPRTIF